MRMIQDGEEYKDDNIFYIGIALNVIPVLCVLCVIGITIFVDCGVCIRTGSKKLDKSAVVKGGKQNKVPPSAVVPMHQTDDKLTFHKQTESAAARAWQLSGTEENK